MRVLSLFDGMSCGQQALERAGIHVDVYFASEIDKHAIAVTQANYPKTIQLGSVTSVDAFNVDLLIGGSPCQSFSFAGKRKGMSTKDQQEIHTLERYLQLKNEGYEFEGQSYLFWEYMRILTHIKEKINPNVKFLLENVIMGEKWEKILSRAIGVNPIEINSSLVSAQNRRRLYWTNIGMEPKGLFNDPESIIEQPKDRKIMLKDILESNVDSKYNLSEKMVSFFIENTKKMKEQGNGFAFKPTNGKGKGKGKGLTTRNGSRMDDNFIFVHCLKEVRSEEAKKERKFNRKKGIDYNSFRAKVIEKRTYGKTGTLLSNPTIDNAIAFDFRYDEGFRTRDNGKSGTLHTKLSGGQFVQTGHIRRLTPTECERLQTVQDGYTNHVNETQRYKMLGNGWTIDVIAHIFKYLKNGQANR